MKYYISMHFTLLILSLAGVLSKVAAQNQWFSLKWMALYGFVLIIMCAYAFMWQQILKYIPLTVAFCNKAITIIWGMLWGKLFFDETIKLNMAIGGMIVFIGIYFVVTDVERIDRS